MGVFQGDPWLLWWLRGKESSCNAGHLGLIPESGRSPGCILLVNKSQPLITTLLGEEAKTRARQTMEMREEGRAGATVNNGDSGLKYEFPQELLSISKLLSYNSTPCSASMES